jgi:hypothetical protein
VNQHEWLGRPGTGGRRNLELEFQFVDRNDMAASCAYRTGVRRVDVLLVAFFMVRLVAGGDRVLVIVMILVLDDCLRLRAFLAQSHADRGKPLQRECGHEEPGKDESGAKHLSNSSETCESQACHGRKVKKLGAMA